jgi:aminopeptidase
VSPSDDRTARLAEIAVAFGANVQPGQIVSVAGEPGHAELVRAITAEAYRRGARFVDAWYFDPLVKRERIAHAAEETLDFVPSWYGERILELGRQRCARIQVAGTTEPDALAGLDPERAGRDQLPRLRESGTVVGERTTNWTIVPFPTEAWARQVHPELDPAAALERLWEEVVHVCRLDEPDPVEAWRERMDATSEAARRLTERRFDALRLEGPGTDVTIGLLPSSRWWNARFQTAEGLDHVPNIPSEEVFTSPDPERVDGVVRSTKPLVLEDGTVVRELAVRFEGGRAVDVEAESGAGTMRGRVAMDEGAARLGELALVDREGRIGRLGTVFYNTLIDENAASHLALGNGFAFAVDDEADRERVNQSGTHIDFMVGSDEVAVTGITGDGDEVPVLRDGAWQL